MELPQVGTHCSEASCRQLDFLPHVCQYCKRTFCQHHFRPVLDEPDRPTTPEAGAGSGSHRCAAMPRDARATVCPVCNRVVPVRRGADPNIAVNDHIAAGCPDPGTSTTKASDNACSFKDCSKRELVPIRCPSCSRTFCIRHRLEADHKCSKMQAAGSSPRTARANLAASAAASRSSQSSAAGQRAKQISEDEQLAKALQRSEEERAGGGSGSGGAKPSNCKVS